MKAQVHIGSRREFRTRYKVAVHCLPTYARGGYELICLELASEVGGERERGGNENGRRWPPVRV